MKIDENLNFLTELEILSGVRIRCVKNGIKDKLEEWNRDYPTVLTSYMYNHFRKLNVSERLNEGSICYVFHSIGLENVYIPLEKDSFIVIGPFSSVYYSTDEINTRLSEYQITPTLSVLRFFTNDLPIVSAQKIDSLKRLICQLFELTSAKQEFLQCEAVQPSWASAFISEKEMAEQKRMFHRHEGLIAINQAVSEGDYEKCLQILSEGSPYKITKHFSAEALENERISAIQNGSLFYFAAVKGGAAPNDADKLYTQSIHKILIAGSAADVHKVSTDMLKAFCELVRNVQSPIHSGLMQQIANYLSFHTDSELDMEDISFTFKIPRGKLEKLFQAEYRTTIAKYHRRVRLEKAAALLNNRALSVGQVAQQTGFPDQNYFARVFRSYYGCTPTQYRLNHMHKQLGFNPFDPDVQ